MDDSVRRFHDLPNGSLVWTRSTDSSFWLGELAGPWRYVEDARARRLDLFCTRPCRWWRLGPEDAVPGKIINNFRPPKTLNSVADAVAVRYTNQVYARLTGSAAPVKAPTATEVITSLLEPGDLEDLVAVFLQDRHDLLLVARGATTRGYEYVLRHRATGRKAVCTVKSGGSAIDPSTLPDDPQVDLWAYAVSGNYGLWGVRQIRTVSTEELAAFVVDRRAVLPDRVAWWLG